MPLPMHCMFWGGCQLRLRWTSTILLTMLLRVAAKFPVNKVPLSFKLAYMPLDAIEISGDKGEKDKGHQWQIDPAKLSQEAREIIKTILKEAKSKLESYLSPLSPLILPRSFFWGGRIPSKARRFAWSYPLAELNGVAGGVSKLVLHDSADHQISFLARGGLVYFDADDKICATVAFGDSGPNPDPMHGIWYGKPYHAPDLESQVDPGRWRDVVDLDAYPLAKQRAWLMPGEGQLQFGGEMFRFGDDKPALLFPFLNEAAQTFPVQLSNCDLVEAFLDPAFMDLGDVEAYLSGGSTSDHAHVKTDVKNLDPAVKAIIALRRDEIKSLSQELSPPDEVLKISNGMQVSHYYMMLPEFQKKFRTDLLHLTAKRNMKYMSYVHPAAFEPPLMSPPAAMNLQVDHMKQQLFFSEGGFLFFGEDPTEQNPSRLVKAYVLVWNTRGHITFGPPIHFRDLDNIDNIFQASRYHDVTNPTFRAGGARKYAWVTKDDNVHEKFGRPMQGFAFIFDDEADSVFYPVVHGISFSTWVIILGIGFACLLVLCGLAFLVGRCITRQRFNKENLQAEVRKEELKFQGPSQSELKKRQTISNTRKSLLSLEQLEQNAATSAAPSTLG